MTLNGPVIKMFRVPYTAIFSTSSPIFPTKCNISKHLLLKQVYSLERQTSLPALSNGFRLKSGGSFQTNYLVKHEREALQFTIQLDPKDETVIAYLKYELENGMVSDSDTKIVNLLSTVVPKDHEGKGIAKILANAAFEYCATNNLHMKLTCWYLDGYLKRNPNPRYNDIVIDSKTS